MKFKLFSFCVLLFSGYLFADANSVHSQSEAWGFFWFIAQPLSWLLEVAFELTCNWGIAIIGVTCLIKLSFALLFRSNQDNLNKMQQLQSKVAQIQKQHAKNRQRQAEKISALYKQAGINPLACFIPIICQLPIYYSLFVVLNNSSELQQASFLWMTSLSAADPYYLLAVLTGLSLVAVQKMTVNRSNQSESKDKNQHSMQQSTQIMMPFLFTAFSTVSPAGLVLYWLSSNLFTLAQNLLEKSWSIIVPRSNLATA